MPIFAPNRAKAAIQCLPSVFARALTDSSSFAMKLSHAKMDQDATTKIAQTAYHRHQTDATARSSARVVGFQDVIPDLRAWLVHVFVAEKPVVAENFV